MSSTEIIIGEAPTEELGEIIVQALGSEGIPARVICKGAPGTAVEIATAPGDAELAKEILAFLQKEIAKLSSP